MLVTLVFSSFSLMMLLVYYCVLVDTTSLFWNVPYVYIYSLHVSNFSQLFGLPTQVFFNARWNCLTPETKFSGPQKTTTEMETNSCCLLTKKTFCFSVVDLWLFAHQRKSFSYTWHVAYISDINRLYMLLRDGHHCFLLILSQRTELESGW